MENTTNTATAPAAFIVGETYEARSACNYESVWAFTVAKRSAKFITLDDGGKTRRVGVKTNADGSEWAMPLGAYSMAPVLSADRPTV